MGTSFVSGLSYVTLFAMIVFFLEWFQTDTVHPIYASSAITRIYCYHWIVHWNCLFLYKQNKKTRENSKYSHFTDWTFLLLLFLTTLTGILMHFFRIYGLPQMTYITYLIHLMVLVPMLMIEVPFSKWSHMIYRPFCSYILPI